MIKELSILVFSENDSTYEKLRFHFKFFSQQNLQVVRVKTLEEFCEKTSEDRIDLCFIDSSLDPVVNQKLWEALRSPSLSSRRAPLIWIGEPTADKRFKIEVELGLSQSLDGPHRLEAESEEIKTSLQVALQYLEFALERTYSIVQLKPGEYLFRQGEIGDHVFVVISGRLEAREKNEDGAELVVGMIEPGEFVGELACLQKARRMADVSAKTNAEVMKIPSAQFEMMLTTKLSWSNKLLMLYAKRLFDLSAKLSKRKAA